nr:unnamed protein product [Callosobruchus analis]
MRKCILAQEHLAVTLRFLATGGSYQSVIFVYIFHTVNVTVLGVCKTIIY